MKQKFSTKWISSTQPRKQRKYRKNAPLHLKGNFLRVHLSAELRKKYGCRAVRVIKGDKVTVLKGSYKKKVTKVQMVSVKRTRVYLEGLEVTRKEGSKKLVSFEPSNLMITELHLEDKARIAKLEKGTKTEAKKEN
jgi:large subunit ribosomal protein L24